MLIHIRSGRLRLVLPMPLCMAGLAIRMIPASAFEELRDGTPEAYRGLVSKQIALFLWAECRDFLREYKGLELVHVEAADGTFVSIRL